MLLSVRTNGQGRMNLKNENGGDTQTTNDNHNIVKTHDKIVCFRRMRSARYQIANKRHTMEQTLIVGFIPWY